MIDFLKNTWFYPTFVEEAIAELHEDSYAEDWELYATYFMNTLVKGISIMTLTFIISTAWHAGA